LFSRAFLLGQCGIYRCFYPCTLQSDPDQLPEECSAAEHFPDLFFGDHHYADPEPVPLLLGNLEAVPDLEFVNDQLCENNESQMGKSKSQPGRCWFASLRKITGCGLLQRKD